MSKTLYYRSRRDVLKLLGAAGLASAFGGVMPRAFAANKLVVGVIYVGPKDDYGYSQA